MFFKRPDAVDGSTSELHQFNRACREQGIALHPDIIHLTNHTVPPAREAPTSTLMAIRTIGRMLRKQPAELLASAPIETTKALPRSVAALALKTIINDSVLGTNSNQNTVAALSPFAIDACVFAEIGFAKTFRNLAGLEFFDKIATGGDIIVDTNDNPIFVRKRAGGIPSALALQEHTINGITYPAGSINRIELDSDYRDPKGILIPKDSCNAIRIVPLESVVAGAFMRLSAYGLPTEERDIFDPALARFEVSWGIKNSVRDITIEEFAAAAATVSSNIQDSTMVF